MIYKLFNFIFCPFLISSLQQTTRNIIYNPINSSFYEVNIIKRAYFSNNEVFEGEFVIISFQRNQIEHSLPKSTTESKICLNQDYINLKLLITQRQKKGSCVGVKLKGKKKEKKKSKWGYKKEPEKLTEICIGHCSVTERPVI